MTRSAAATSAAVPSSTRVSLPTVTCRTSFASLAAEPTRGIKHNSFECYKLVELVMEVYRAARSTGATLAACAPWASSSGSPRVTRTGSRVQAGEATA